LQKGHITAVQNKLKQKTRPRAVTAVYLSLDFGTWFLKKPGRTGFSGRQNRRTIQIRSRVPILQSTTFGTFMIV